MSIMEKNKGSMWNAVSIMEKNKAKLDKWIVEWKSKRKIRKGFTKVIFKWRHGCEGVSHSYTWDIHDPGLGNSYCRGVKAGACLVVWDIKEMTITTVKRVGGKAVDEVREIKWRQTVRVFQAMVTTLALILSWMRWCISLLKLP